MFFSFDIVLYQVNFVIVNLISLLIWTYIWLSQNISMAYMYKYILSFNFHINLKSKYVRMSEIHRKLHRRMALFWCFGKWNFNVQCHVGLGKSILIDVRLHTDVLHNFIRQPTFILKYLFQLIKQKILHFHSLWTQTILAVMSIRWLCH